MSEFDKLLSEVLAADVCVEPPLWMERRLRAALLAARERRPLAVRFLREAMAAAVLLGVAGLLVVRHRVAVSAPAVSPAPELAGRAAMPVVDAMAALSVKRDIAAGKGAVAKLQTKRVSAKAVANVIPLTVAPLRVEPIEVASLNFDTATRSMNEGARR